jgi:23S rRNA (uracil1939-C5)-methyltransferase
VAALTATEAPRLVLVSCDPGSLGRDVRLLGDAGYELRSVELVDAFPDTFHVEAVCRFDRR